MDILMVHVYKYDSACYQWEQFHKSIHIEYLHMYVFLLLLSLRLSAHGCITTIVVCTAETHLFAGVIVLVTRAVLVGLAAAFYQLDNCLKSGKSVVRHGSQQLLYMYHPYSLGEGISGYATMSCCQIMHWLWALKIPLWRAAFNGGNFSPSISFWRKGTIGEARVFLMGVPRIYS